MSWCTHCDDETPTIRDPDKGYIICARCGRILDQEVYFTGPTFVKDGSGQSRASGSVMHSVQSGYSASRERTLEKGKDEINYILEGLQISGGLSMTNLASSFYKIAVDKNFTKGRRTTHVAASCVYIACRHTKKAYLLIDFSDFLQVNVYVLGAVFLQLCKVLCLSETPIVQKLVDPSLFMWRFTERLLKKKDKEVADTAIRIVASMKRDWMQTGRKPSGICGAALYISTLAHGLNFPKSEIIRVVHICEATLTKRLIEFENTESGSLTIEEFNARADELDEEPRLLKMPTPGEVLCKHKDKKPPHFAHGLCEKCYKKFNEISGGLDGSAEPPAFQRAERQRIEKEKQEKSTKHIDLGSHHNKDKNSSGGISPGNDKGESGVNRESSKADASTCNGEVETGNERDDESEGLSDIDDLEVDGYIHNDEEKELKRIIWEEMNKEYIEEQAAKEAVLAAARKAYDTSIANGSPDLLAARELAEATAAALAKSKKERRQRRAEEAKNSTPAETPLEATRQMLKRKGFSSKINYEALDALYTNENENSKKKKAEEPSGEQDGQPIDNEENEDADQENVSEIDVATAYNDKNLKTGYDYYDGDYGDGDYGDGGDGDYTNNYDFDF